MGGQVPQSRRVVVATGHEPMTIRADGHGPDCVLVAELGAIFGVERALLGVWGAAARGRCFFLALRLVFAATSLFLPELSPGRPSSLSSVVAIVSRRRFRFGWSDVPSQS